MLPKELIKSCLAGESISVTPAYRYWFDDKFIDMNKAEVEKMKQVYDDDFVQGTIGEWGVKWTVKDQIPKRGIEPDLEPGEFTDDWNCRFCAAPDGVGEHPTRPVVTNFEEWEEYKAERLPLIDETTFAKGLTRIVGEHPDHYVLGQFWRTFFERMYMICGFENLMFEIGMESELFFDIRKTLLEWTIKGIKLIAESGADAVFLADDWGTQRTLQISPDSWRKLFKSAYAEMIETAHGLGLDVWLHSCGNIISLVPEWIDIKLDVLAHLQNGALDLDEVAKNYKGQMTFFGGIDVQDNLVNGTRESIHEEVKHFTEIFDSCEGNHILAPSNTIMPETPAENVWHLFEAFEKYGTRK